MYNSYKYVIFYEKYIPQVDSLLILSAYFVLTWPSPQTMSLEGK